jgi:hypothetical protein
VRERWFPPHGRASANQTSQVEARPVDKIVAIALGWSQGRWNLPARPRVLARYLATRSPSMHSVLNLEASTAGLFGPLAPSVLQMSLMVRLELRQSKRALVLAIRMGIDRGHPPSISICANRSIVTRFSCDAIRLVKQLTTASLPNSRRCGDRTNMLLVADFLETRPCRRINLHAAAYDTWHRV